MTEVEDGAARSVSARRGWLRLVRGHGPLTFARTQPCEASSAGPAPSSSPASSPSSPAGGARPVAVSDHIDNDHGNWRRWVFPGIWLVYLSQTASGVHRHSSGPWAILGYVILVAFSALYLVSLPLTFPAEPRRIAASLGVMLAMLVVEAFLAHQDASAMCVYIGVVLISGLGRWGPAAVVGLTIVAVVTPVLVPSWHAGLDWDIAFTMGAVSLLMYGFFAILQSNRDLSAARSEVARLAAENERSRIARDLHDLLGHSLTTITVKAALARRLMERDPARAAQEIGEVEELTRTTLTDVRAAVGGYREITLAGELATAHEVLRAGGITAHTPRAIDEVRPQYRELFAWVVREAVTNVLRHSRAQACTITVGANWLEIADDGRGAQSGEGHGLRGLRERVEAFAGTVTARSGAIGGWTLRVDLPPVPADLGAGDGSRAGDGRDGDARDGDARDGDGSRADDGRDGDGRAVGTGAVSAPASGDAAGAEPRAPGSVGPSARPSLLFRSR